MMRRRPSTRKNLFSSILFASLAALLFTAQDLAASDLPITPTPSKERYRPGDTVLVALRASVPEGYHLYGNPLGPGIGKPLAISVEGGQMAWQEIFSPPASRYTPSFGDWVFTHKGEVTFFLMGIAPEVDSVTTVTETVVIDGLICHTACMPVNAELSVGIIIDPEALGDAHFAGSPALKEALARATHAFPVTRRTVAQPESQASLMAFASEEGEQTYDYEPRDNDGSLVLWQALFLAFLAGIILNAMPCVLPVIGIKVLSFAQGRERGGREAVIHSLYFAAGIMVIFLLLATIASFAQFSWGQHFQDPRVIVAIGALIVVFALGLFDVYTIILPSSMTKGSAPAAGWWGDFSRGVFATILATPCSGPFLGAVIAWTISQPSSVIFSVYAAIGAGMSFPYILLSSNRRLLKLIPAPGRWMDDLKGLMGFLLIGFAAYLLLGLPPGMTVPAVSYFVIVAFLVVLYSRFVPWTSGMPRKLFGIIFVVAAALSGFWLLVIEPKFEEVSSRPAAVRAEGELWQPFSTESLLEAHAKGRNVMVDFTASWCLNCQYNDVAVLNTGRIAEKIEEKGILALKADMTQPDAEQDTLLRRLGSRSIPFLAVFPADDPHHPIVLRDLLTIRKVLDVLEKLPGK